MSNEKRLYISHFAARKRTYNLACMKRWFWSNNLSWDHFKRHGVTVSDLRDSATGSFVYDVDQIVDFVDGNDLWDLEKLAEFRRNNNT